MAKYVWSLISIHQKLSEDFIEHHQEQVILVFDISKYQKLSEDFIERHQKQVVWPCILVFKNHYHQNLLKNIKLIFLIHFKYFDVDVLLLNMKIDALKTKIKYADYFTHVNWHEISMRKNLPMDFWNEQRQSRLV